jgi:hypothetical protein
MLRQIFVGSSIGALNIVVHALLTVATIGVARNVASRGRHPCLGRGLCLHQRGA